MFKNFQIMIKITFYLEWLYFETFFENVYNLYKNISKNLTLF